MEKNIVKKDISIDGIYNVCALVLMFASFYFVNIFKENIVPAINWFYVIWCLVLQVLSCVKVENMYFFEKEMTLGKNYHFRLPLLLIGISIIELVVQYVTKGRQHGMHHILNSLVLIPVGVFLLCRYLYKINERMGCIDAIASKMSWGKARLYGMLGVIYLYVHWLSYKRDNFSAYSLLINIIYDWLVIVILLILCTYVYYALYELRKRPDDGTNFKFFFPYKFMMACAMIIIIWGSYAFYDVGCTFESAYYITIVVYLTMYIVFGGIIYLGIGRKAEKRDWIIFCGITCILLGYMALVLNATIVNQAVAGNMVGNLVSALSLIGMVAIVVICIKFE